MPDDLLGTARRWQAQWRPAVVVEVRAHQGSVPRETGTRMLVAADEAVGTIGGGHLELKAIADARELLQPPVALSPSQGEGRGRSGEFEPRAASPQSDVGLQADMRTAGEGECLPRQGAGGLACISPSPQPSPSREREREREQEREQDGLQLDTVVQRIALGPSLGQCCGGVLELAFTPLAACDLTTWPVPAPLFTLQLYGAGHVGRAIVRLLGGIHCRVQWIDEREAEFPTDPLPPHIERVCVEPVYAEVAAAPRGACYLVLTHSHELDLAITQAILARGDFGYFGLIGSKTKRARFEHRLRDRGLAPSIIERMTCPIGVPGIEGKEPEVIAVGVVAQLLQVAAALRSGA